ncbi:MAG: hypothetical protein U0744_21110 [Gemmataceae bacterium]
MLRRIEKALARCSPCLRRLAVNLVAHIKRYRLESYRPLGCDNVEAAEALERAGFLRRVGPCLFSLVPKAEVIKAMAVKEAAEAKVAEGDEQ